MSKNITYITRMEKLTITETFLKNPSFFLCIFYIADTDIG